MLRKSYFASLAAAALLAAPSFTSADAAGRDGANLAPAVIQHGEQESDDYDEKEESRQKFQLAPGSRVEVSSIRGPVDIETADVSEAEVHVVRLARSRRDLSFHRVAVEQTGAGLVVRGVQEEEANRNVRVRHRVTLRLPRRVELTVRSINGRTNIGEIDGAVSVESINGGLRVARASQHAEIEHVNGGVTLTVAGLGSSGVSLQHINGGVDLRFTDEVNADLEVSNTNGGVTASFTDLSPRPGDDPHRRTIRRRIGAGGAPITISHVNGGVTLSRA